MRAGFDDGFRGFKIGTRIVSENIENGGSYKFLRLRVTDGEHRAVFRLITNTDGGLNYQELILDAHEREEPRIIDIYIHASGERLSETFRRFLVPAIVEKNKSVLAKLTGQQSDFVKSMPKIAAMQALVKQRKHVEALAAFKALPVTVQTEKSLLLYRIFIAVEVNDQEYMAAINALRKAFPGDPCQDLISLDALMLKKKYAEAIQAAERIDKAIGGDPYLHFFRGSIYLAWNRFGPARECMKKAIAEEPTLSYAYFGMMNICLEEKDHAGVASMLVKLEEDLGMEVSGLEDVPEYAGFVKSAEYRKWMAGRKRSSEDGR